MRVCVCVDMFVVFMLCVYVRVWRCKYIFGGKPEETRRDRIDKSYNL